MPEQILKPNDERKTESAVTRFVDDVEKINRTAGFLRPAWR